MYVAEMILPLHALNVFKKKAGLFCNDPAS
jgi:hypothetical protein